MFNHTALKKYSKLSVLLLVIVLALSVVFVSGCSKENEEPNGDNGNNEGEDIFLRIGTAGTGGAYYPVGGAMAEVLSRHLEGVYSTAEVTGGAAENPRLVGTGELELGFTNSDLLYYAYEGMAPFEEKYAIGAVLEFGPSVVHLVTIDDDIKTIEDLKGKRIAVGPAGGSLATAFEQYIQFYGFTFEDITPSYVSQSEGMSLLVDKSVDAAISHGAPPVAAVMELSARRPDFKILAFGDDKVTEITAEHPYFSKFVIEAGTYGESPAEDTQVIAVGNYLFAPLDMDEDLVYNVLETLYDNMSFLQDAHPSNKFIPTDKRPDSPIPFHPGAERFYNDKGM